MIRILAALAVLATPAAAEMATLGDLRIATPVLRATPPAAPVAGGFLRITNTGTAGDTLVAAAIAPEVAGRVELHAMEMNDGVMSMIEVEGGIDLPAGETVTLMPGGLHLMLFDLGGPLVAGDSHAVTLTFAEAGEITLDMPVAGLGEIRAIFEEAGGMGHGASGHGN
ncbi:copper chaperone PCu(A)C [uncultured Jannaschia sp.]|uniref:copper chaperone PCu(A)C n=1 Tax=uncultured Jannaschia sp. TaxID=293347 RepID=UPI0026143A4D|nr:copper chaperone PCu(A)C [uncultured Jannaschia sp.]